MIDGAPLLAPGYKVDKAYKPIMIGKTKPGAKGSPNSIKARPHGSDGTDGPKLNAL